jgi:hypothetical protein
MNTKHLSILAILTLMVVIAAVVLTQPKTTTTETTKFFPDLLSNLENVTEIKVTTKDDSATLIRNAEGQWGLKEKHHYPVAADKIRNLLIGAADLTILEPKTSNPELYSKIGVEDVTAEGSNSAQVTFQTAEGKTVGSVIVGDDRIAKVDSTRREIYVRKPDDKQTWLTLGQLPLEKKTKNWLLDEIIHIENDDIRQLSLTQIDGEKTLIFKNQPDDQDYQLADLPENAKVKSTYTLKNMATTLSHLKLDDVTVASDVEFDDNAVNSAVFSSFDGLEVTMLTTQKEDKYYAKFEATFNPDMVWIKPETDETEPEAKDDAQETTTTKEDKSDDEPKVDAKTLAETLNTKLTGWVYELAKYKVEDLAKKSEELIEIEAEEMAEEATPSFDLPELDFNQDLPTPFSIPQGSEFGTPSTTR